MIRKYVLPLLALAGVVFGVVMVRAGARKPLVALPVSEPAHATYNDEVAGAGIVESSTENIAVATPVPGVATVIYVKVGDRVKAGDPLFKLDDRNLQASLAVQKATVLSAKAKLRVEDAGLADLKNTLESYSAVADTRAVSKEELDRKRFAADTGAARVASATAEVEGAEAGVKSIETDIQRITVNAPIDGRVLQVNLRLGEYAPAGPVATPLMMLGNVDVLHVRVDVDENDAWRVRGHAAATAFVRGNVSLHAPLTLVRIEPFVLPKKSLTGDSTERVDTRVLQVIYSFDPAALPVYVGQQLDVKIDAQGADRAVEPPTTQTASAIISEQGVSK